MKNKTFQYLEDDGLPPIGLYLSKGDAYYCFIDGTTNKGKVSIEIKIVGIFQKQ